MKWQQGDRRGNIDDRRGSSGGQRIAFGGIGGIVILLIAWMCGADPSLLLNQIATEQTTQVNEQGEYQSTPEEDRLMDFSDVVLTSTYQVWSELFKQQGKTYTDTKLVVYTGGTQTQGCGQGLAQYGPFYCPADQTVYLDLSFNRELSTKFGAKGEFALAYVIAHEVGHHIQNLLGVMEQTNAMRQRMSETEYNKISVMTELQADFYAGVWAHYANEYSKVELEYNDILEGMRAAEAVGDDHIQESAQGYSNPESFTHGTSEQRAYWFKKGYDTGDMDAGNTFNDRSLQ
ncbi:KPN_02809 family neutral zinc metallopeptidase [Sphingobacterium hungaricum]